MKKDKLNVNKASLVEATILAMTGGLKLEEEKEVITEDIQVETEEVEVVVGEEATIIETEEATITVEEKETEEVVDEEEVIEVPVESDETIIPEEVIAVEEPVEEVPTIDEIVDEEPIQIDEETVEANDEEVVEESVELTEELTDKEFPDDGTYWNGNGRFQSDVELLNKLIPTEGKEATIPGILPTKLVADYITLSNKYYRWFNDGDVPFKKLADGTVIYPSYTRGDKAKTGLGKKTINSISFDLEQRVNALIEKINDEVPDWKEKLQAAEAPVEEVVEESKEIIEESIEVVEEDYSEKLGGEPADFVNDVKALLRELKTIETENFATQLAKEMVYEFEETCESQIRIITAIYNLEEEKEILEEEVKEELTEATEIVEESVEVVEESVELTEEEVCEDPDCEKEELVEEKTYSEESFQKIIEGFYKEQFKTLAEFKLNNVTKTEEGIQVEGTLVNKFGKTRDICLEGKCIQKGKSFLKYSIKESAGLKLESKFADKLSMMTFTNKDNVLECKYLKQKAAKQAE